MVIPTKTTSAPAMLYTSPMQERYTRWVITVHNEEMGAPPIAYRASLRVPNDGEQHKHLKTWYKYAAANGVLPISMYNPATNEPYHVCHTMRYNKDLGYHTDYPGARIIELVFIDFRIRFHESEVIPL